MRIFFPLFWCPILDSFYTIHLVDTWEVLYFRTSKNFSKHCLTSFKEEQAGLKYSWVTCLISYHDWFPLSVSSDSPVETAWNTVLRWTIEFIFIQWEVVPWSMRNTLHGQVNLSGNPQVLFLASTGVWQSQHGALTP